MPQEDAVVLSLLSPTPGIPAASPLQSFLDLPLVYFATLQSGCILPPWIPLQGCTGGPLSCWALLCSFRAGWPWRWSQLPSDEHMDSHNFQELNLSSLSFWGNPACGVVKELICNLRVWGGGLDSLSNCLSSLNGVDVAIFSSLPSLCTWICFLNFFFLL